MRSIKMSKQGNEILIRVAKKNGVAFMEYDTELTYLPKDSTFEPNSQEMQQIMVEVKKHRLDFLMNNLTCSYSHFENT